MSNSPAHLRNICKAIDKLVVQVSAVPRKLGEDMKMLAAYLLEVESLPARIEEQRAKLAACATPSKEVVAASARITKRMWDNWECSLKSDGIVAGLRTTMRRKQQVALSVHDLKAELDAFVASGKERHALHLELWAEYIALVEVDRCRRQAKAIRAELELAKLMREQDELNGRLDEAIHLAEGIAMDLDRRARNRQRAIAARKQQAAEAARITEAEATEAAAKKAEIPGFEGIEFEDTCLDSLPETAPPKIDSGLVAYMELEGLDPKDPDAVALAMATASQSDIAAARELFNQP